MAIPFDNIAERDDKSIVTNVTTKHRVMQNIMVSEDLANIEHSSKIDEYEDS